MSWFRLSTHHPSANCPALARTVAACLILISATLLAGCAGEGMGAAADSNTSGATDATAPLAGALAQAPAASEDNLLCCAGEGMGAVADSSTLSTIGATATLAWASAQNSAASGDGLGAAANSNPSSVRGATATLEWEPSQDPSVSGYYVHYGKQHTEPIGSCAYEESQFVSTPNATITNLDFNTQYYLAVSAYNGIESPCSREVSIITSAS